MRNSKSNTIWKSNDDFLNWNWIEFYLFDLIYPPGNCKDVVVIMWPIMFYLFVTVQIQWRTKR